MTYRSLFLFPLAAAASLVLLLVVSSQPLHAQAPCELDPRACPTRMDAESARGMGAGLGLRATAVSTSALAYNPAGLAGAPLYHVAGNVDYIGGDKTVALGGAVVDSATSPVAAGLSLRGFLSGSHGGYDGIDGRLAFAFPFSDVISIGLTGRYVNIGTELLNDAGTYSDKKVVEGFSLDSSVQIHAGDMFHISVGAYNFVDQDSPLMPVMAGISAALMATENLAFGIDSLMDFTSFGSPKPTLGGAVEFLAGQAFPLRAGYTYDNGRHLHQVSAGVGYTDAIVGLDLSLRQDVAGGVPPKDTRIMGAMRFYIN